MSLTDKLLAVHRVESSLRGLKSRLNAADRFLQEQNRQLGELTSKREAVESQIRQLKASSSAAEGESGRLEARIEQYREQMNNARTNKEYKVFLTEANSLKIEKSRFEEEGIGLLTKADQLGEQLAEIDGQIEERTGVRDVAKQERDTRESEIAGRVAELEAERDSLIGDVPGDTVQLYRKLVTIHDDEAMSPIEIQDRKRHEFTCGACMMSVPVETMSSLLSRGDLTRCVSCGCILYLEEKTREAMTAKR